MDLFAAAGINLGRGGRGARSGPALPQSLRVPLLNQKVVDEARRLAALDPSPAELAAACDYARKARNARFLKQAETAVRTVFIEEVVKAVLGYRAGFYACGQLL